MELPSVALSAAPDCDTLCDSAAPWAVAPSHRRAESVTGLITGLALSVTDRSDLACRLWPRPLMPLPRRELLTVEEIDRIVTTFVHLGVRRIRLVGGDPLVRRGIGTLIRILCRHLSAGTADEVIVATRGNRLAGLADTLAAGGLRHVEVWLPSRNEERFHQLSPGGDVATLLDGIACAKEAGVTVRLNTVLLPGINDDELDALIEWCGAAGTEIILVEPPAGFRGSPAAMQRLRARLARRWTLEPTDPIPIGPDLRSSSHRFRVAETGGCHRPLKQPPGNACARVSATGQLYCAAEQVEAIDLRRALRVGPRGLGIEGLIRAAISLPPMREPRADAVNA